MDRATQPRLVFTAMSKSSFYYREMISAFVFKGGCIPVNPFMLFGYFLSDMIERDRVREANNFLISKVDELWVFGPISDGVVTEIALAKRLAMPVKYFAIIDSARIEEISEDEAEYEVGVRTG
jgi:hypothetical protein